MTCSAFSETARDLITSVEAKWSTTSRTRYAYAYDDRRQRSSVVQSGDVFADYGGTDNGAIHQIFTYNGRGEVTAAGTFLGATATDQTMPLSARKHEFDYDGIGNRKWSNTSGNSALRDDYTVNELNQYTLRENNTLAVGGTVANDSNIKVAAGSTAAALAGRQGRHWGDNITLENSVAPFQGDLSIYAVNATTNKKMVETRTAFIPPTAQAMTYDDDGNITNDGVWTYEWDAENRLTAMQTTLNAIAGGVPAQRLEFKYDYQHRRVEKLVRGGWNGSAFTTVASQRRYGLRWLEHDRGVLGDLTLPSHPHSHSELHLGLGHREKPDRRRRCWRAAAGSGLHDEQGLPPKLRRQRQHRRAVRRRREFEQHRLRRCLRILPLRRIPALRRHLRERKPLPLQHKVHG